MHKRFSLIPALVLMDARESLESSAGFQDPNGEALSCSGESSFGLFFGD